MKVSKESLKTARRLYQISLVDGELNEKTLKAILAKLTEQKPRGYREVLNALQRLVERYFLAKEVIIESAEKVPAAEKKELEAKLVAEHGSGLSFNYQKDVALLGGLKIQVGSVVYDGSVKARLNQISEVL
mgnify:CR=1 FL=1